MHCKISCVLLITRLILATGQDHGTNQNIWNQPRLPYRSENLAVDPDPLKRPDSQSGFTTNQQTVSNSHHASRYTNHQSKDTNKYMVCYLNDPNSQPSEVRSQYQSSYPVKSFNPSEFRTTQYQPIKPHSPLYATSNPENIRYTTSLDNKPFIPSLPIPENKQTYTADKYRHPSVLTVEQQSQYSQHPVHKQLASNTQSADQDIRSYRRNPSPDNLRSYSQSYIPGEAGQSQYKYPYRADKSIPTRALYQSNIIDNSRINHPQHSTERLEDSQEKITASREEEKAVDENNEKAYSYYNYHP